ncbi:hypothetical protein FRB91_006391, partial [Serendipita sp. 411]
AGKDEKGLPAEEEKKDDNDDNDPKAKEKDAPPPVSMFQLYRFSTRLEIIFNLIGLVLAIASGATQVSTCPILRGALFRLNLRSMPFLATYDAPIWKLNRRVSIPLSIAMAVLTADQIR